MYMLFIYGPVASGKYTVARKLSELLGVPLFHNHLAVDLVLTLFEFGSSPFISLREEIWLSSFKTASEVGKSFIFTFAPDATVRPEFIKNVQTIIGTNGGKVFFVELLCSETVIEQRIGDERRAAFGKICSVEFYRQLRADGAFEFPSLPKPLLSIHTDRKTPEEAAGIILEKLNCNSIFTQQY